MKKHLPLLLVAAALLAAPRSFAESASVTAPAVVAKPAVGSPAPELGVPDADGRIRTLAEFSGKVVAVEWLNPGCPFVKKFYGAGKMQALQKELTAKGVVWLTVASTAAGHPDHKDAAALKAWMAGQGGAPTAILVDASGALARRYAAKTTPHMFVIGTDGRLAYMGAIDSVRSAKAADIPKAVPYLANAVGAALAGKPAEPADTAPYGCSVKL